MKTSMTIVYITTELFPAKRVKATLFTLRKWLKKIHTSSGHHMGVMTELLVNENCDQEHPGVKEDHQLMGKILSDEEMKNIANDNLVNEWRELLEKAIQQKRGKQP